MSCVATRPSFRSTAMRISGPFAARAAANDSVFRWKMAAGFASVAAVAAVGWGVMLAGGGLGGRQGTQLAAVTPDAVVVASAPASAAAPLSVNTLAGIQEVGRITGYFEGGEGAAFGMLRDGVQKLCGGIVEKLDFPVCRCIAGILLLKHLNHHVVR